MSRKAFLLSSLLMVVAVWGFVVMPVAEAQTVDHYNCYQGKDLKNPKFVPLAASLSDELRLQIVDVKKLKFVCPPVDKNGEGIINPSVHLCAYAIKGEKLSPRPGLEVLSQFQKSQFEAKQAKLLLVPCTGALIP